MKFYPVDIPNPNQENVYYSTASIKGKMLEYFEKQRVDEILEILKEYYLPKFVFDTDGGPDVYNLDVYPTHGSKQSIQLDSSGSIVDLQKIAQPTISAPDKSNLNDGFFDVALDPSFHSSSKLKSPNNKDYPVDEDVSAGVDLILSTKWQKDPTIEEKYQNFIILKNLLLAQLKTLPDEEMESFQNLYTETLETIDDFERVLTQIEEGQSSSIDGINYESIFSEIYEKGTGAQTSLEGLEATSTLVAQALSDLANSKSSTGAYTYRGSLVTSLGTIGFQSPTYQPGSRRVWNNFLFKLKEAGILSPITAVDGGPLTPRSGNVASPSNIDVQRILKYASVPVFSKDGKPKEWYYQNFQRTLVNQETNWDSLKDYLDRVKDTLEPYEKKSNLESIGGCELLVDQAIMKAILKLSMTNLDVTEFAPVDEDGNNFFAKIMRSGALGPSGVTPFPSKYSIDPEQYQVMPYTNTAFLCYHSLLTIINSVGDSSSRAFLEENIKEPDSDHDKVIDLMIDVHSGTITGSTSVSSAGGTSRNIQVLLHLYKQMEEFPMTQNIYLIPEEDSVPSSERSFVQWYLKRIRHETEFGVRNSLNSEEGYRFLEDDYPSSVEVGGNRGKLDTQDVPQVYADMGFLSPLPENASFNKRLLKANYGIPTPPNGFTRDVSEFYKQRRYSMPYFWSSMTSLWRALTSEILKNMIDSVNDITGEEINMSTAELFEMMSQADIASLWIRIRTLVRELIDENGIEFRIFASVDGTLNFVERNAEGGALANSVQYRNTPGLNTKVMLQSYVKFVSMISDHSSARNKEKHTPIAFDASTYLPPESMANNLNPNYANNHGGSSQYIQPQFEPYFDKLEFIPLEFTSKLPIKKSISPIGEDISIINEKYNSFLSDNQRLFQHLRMFESILTSFENIETFVNGFSVGEGIKNVFISGDISLTEDLQDPRTLKRQIARNRIKYESNESGLGRRWEWRGWAPEKLHKISKRGHGWLYVQVLGLESKLWSSPTDTVVVVPELITANEIIEIEGARHRFGFFDTNSRDERLSQDILKYLHLSAGLDISELTFSRDLALEYSDLLVDSESEVFPWAKGDFEERVPTKQLETLYNMSPLLFPRNLFKDVCIPNKYQKVVACVITKADLQGTGISVEEVDGAIDDIIGSLRWKVLRE
tara:strand:+ start:5291 stop:8779 length:3489 start_codon:yes stop_codon:yes gene_type:complete